jgi:uncharacterized OB-fold protein
VSAAASFPTPVSDADTQSFWEAAAARRLVVPRCAECDAWCWQPKPICSRCHADALVWTQLSGDARVLSWSALYPPLLPAFADHAPFVVLLVELLEAAGVRMLGPLVSESGAIITTAGDGLEIGDGVTLVWREQEGFVIPAWSR